MKFKNCIFLTSEYIQYFVCQLPIRAWCWRRVDVTSCVNESLPILFQFLKIQSSTMVTCNQHVARSYIQFKKKWFANNILVHKDCNNCILNMYQFWAWSSFWPISGAPGRAWYDSAAFDDFLPPCVYQHCRKFWSCTLKITYHYLVIMNVQRITFWVLQNDFTLSLWFLHGNCNNLNKIF